MKKILICSLLITLVISSCGNKESQNISIDTPENSIATSVLATPKIQLIIPSIEITSTFISDNSDPILYLRSLMLTSDEVLRMIDGSFQYSSEEDSESTITVSEIAPMFGNNKSLEIIIKKYAPIAETGFGNECQSGRAYYRNIPPTDSNLNITWWPQIIKNNPEMSENAQVYEVVDPKNPYAMLFFCYQDLSVSIKYNITAGRHFGDTMKDTLSQLGILQYNKIKSNYH
jgi:hypothetical protein